MSTVDIGRLGEKQAAKFLKKNKFKILERNIHISHNEIDIIAKNKEYIVFVEVKTRSTGEDLYSAFGTPASAVDVPKQRRTLEAARVYLKSGRYSHLQPRFDVIEVYISKDDSSLLHINHITNAFGA